MRSCSPVSLIQTLLFEIAPGDPFLLATAAAMLLAVAVLGGGMPALRAARVNPIVALRAE